MTNLEQIKQKLLKTLITCGLSNYIAEQVVGGLAKDLEKTIKEVESTNPSFYRQLFREMPEGRTFTAKEIADMFEIHAPFDPDKVVGARVMEYLEQQPSKKFTESRK